VAWQKRGRGEGGERIAIYGAALAVADTMVYKHASKDSIGKLICKVCADTDTSIATKSTVQAVQDLVYSRANCDATPQDVLVLVNLVCCYITC